MGEGAGSKVARAWPPGPTNADSDESSRAGNRLPSFISDMLANPHVGQDQEVLPPPATLTYPDWLAVNWTWNSCVP